MKILERFNPFAHVIGGRFARHAVTLTTSIPEKFNNAIEVLLGINSRGGLIYANPKNQAGILDYATLFLDPLLSYARYKLNEAYTNKNLAAPIRYFAQGLNFVLLAPHFLLRLTLLAITVIVTLATAFITGIVHGFSEIAKKSLLADAKNLELSDNSKYKIVTLRKAVATKDKDTYRLAFEMMKETDDQPGWSFPCVSAPVTVKELSAPKQTPHVKAVAALVKLNKIQVGDLIEQVIDNNHTGGESRSYDMRFTG